MISGRPGARLKEDPGWRDGFAIPGLKSIAKRGRMRQSTRDKVAGTVKEEKGKIKEKVGRMTDDPDMVDRGTGEKIAGKIQKKVGDIEKVFEK